MNLNVTYFPICVTSNSPRNFKEKKYLNNNKLDSDISGIIHESNTDI